LAKIEDPRAIDAIAARLSEPQDRNSAAAALRAFGPAAEDAMLEQLTSQDLWVRMEACKVLAEIGSGKSLPALQTATGDSNGLVSSAAKTAIQAVETRSGRGLRPTTSSRE
jgi:HEAT repeat protein